jgi:hypothetical protein
VLRAAVVVAGVLATLPVVVPARAEHVAAAVSGGITIDAPTGTALDLHLEIGAGGFRLGGRVSGRGGDLGGAWLNGEALRHGFRLDGGVDHGGRRHDFMIDGDLGAWFGRAKRVEGVTEL